MSAVQDYLISQEIKITKQVAEIAINKALPTMLDVAKGMAKWLSGQSSGKREGLQTLEQLMKYGDKLSEIPLNSDNIKDFTHIARKHGVAFALVKDESKTPPRHTVYFKAKDTESMSAAFRAYIGKELGKDKSKSLPFKKRLNDAKEKVKVTDKDKKMRREVGER
ncbi:MAG: PcfB family protein [Defluviitaleaceae bacterium]|nr:PcfB family protein [Defluviitaleaceae bacterium]